MAECSPPEFQIVAPVRHLLCQPMYASRDQWLAEKGESEREADTSHNKSYRSEVGDKDERYGRSSHPKSRFPVWERMCGRKSTD